MSEPCLDPRDLSPHCPYSLWLCRLGGSDGSRGRGIAAPSLHSQGHCVGGAGASPSALHQCHQRGPDPRHSCLQDQKASFLCGKPKNHWKQIVLLIIRARQKTEQPLGEPGDLLVFRKCWTHFERPAGTFWKESRARRELHKSTFDPTAELQPLWSEGLGPCCLRVNSFSLGSASMGRSLYLSPLEIQGGTHLPDLVWLLLID